MICRVSRVTMRPFHADDVEGVLALWEASSRSAGVLVSQKSRSFLGTSSQDLALRMTGFSMCRRVR